MIRAWISHVKTHMKYSEICIWLMKTHPETEMTKSIQEYSQHHGLSCYAMVFKILALVFVFYLLQVSCKGHTVYLWTLNPIYIYQSLPLGLRLVVNLGCWTNLVWSNRVAPLTNENKWWLPWALASTELWLLSTSYSYFKCWFIVMQNQTPAHPSLRLQYEWHSGHSQWMEKKMGMERCGKRRFLE